MKINLSHGNGAEETSELIDEIFMKHFKNKWSEGMEDAAVLDLPAEHKLVFTTDSFVVKPLFFQGGDIGKLAICGTVNDLLTAGATPLYLSASFIIEEGMDTDTLLKIAQSMSETAKEAGVSIVTGDTKVIEGNGGVYINTSGVGAVKPKHVTFQNAQEGDALIVTGNLGDHHASILSQRMGIENTIASDVAPLNEIVKALKAANIALHGMRDITRGGLATVLNEVSKSSSMKAVLWEDRLPVGEEVKGLCGILGLDPLYMGNEGKMLIAVSEQEKERAVEIIRSKRYGENAAIIGTLQEGKGVVLTTRLGGERVIPPLSGEGLPRIC